VHAAIFFRFLNHVAEKIPPVTGSPWSVIVDVLLLRKDFFVLPLRVRNDTIYI
jgi:hypothetical protein